MTKEIILPAIVVLVNILIVNSAWRLLLKVHLFNNISHKIQDIVEDINYQLIETIKEIEFRLQIIKRILVGYAMYCL